ncbi:MAG TPA: hypothetical protein VHI97_02810 [Actinomycetota bacterium]|nr:hypothetical protein [Actinomycetota bacterium]
MEGPRLVRHVALIGVTLMLTAVGSNVAGAQERSVRLPTERDALLYTPYAQMLLFGSSQDPLVPLEPGKGLETQLPTGGVEDQERVEVGLETDGSISRVVVFQRLVLSGLGDFQFRVPGPARDVSALPGSATDPGLRKGSVLWQGFSSGREVLAAEVDLNPNLERERLPLEFDIDMSVDGQALEPGNKASGPFQLKLRVSNSSEFPLQVASADADPTTLAPILDRVRTVLARGERPVPGRHGLPKAIPIEGRSTVETREVGVPFGIRGRLVFPSVALGNVRVSGAKAKIMNGSIVVPFREFLPGGDSDWQLSVSGIAYDLGLPELEIRAEPSLPLPGALEPPTGTTWEEAIDARPSDSDGREMLSRLMETMWEVARVRQFDAYLGNPDPTGESDSTYLFRLSPRVAPPPTVAPPPPPSPGPIGIAAFGVAVLALLTGLGVLWSRS